MQYFDDIVNHMKSLAEYFIPYNFPKVPPKEEDEINILKFREAMVDGYNVILHYNKHILHFFILSIINYSVWTIVCKFYSASCSEVKLLHLTIKTSDYFLAKSEKRIRGLPT
jgi:hypothetical protein